MNNSTLNRIASILRVLPAVAILHIAQPDAIAAQNATAVRGTVRHAVGGAPVAGAVVQVRGTELATQTDNRGQYQIVGIPAGSHVIVARRLGLQEAEQTVTVGAGAVAVADFQLTEEALLIPAVVVSATLERQRLSETAASVGVISSEDLHAAKPTHPSAVMGQVPGVWVNVTGGEGHMTSIRQPIGTKPLYLFLEDGVPTRSTGFFNHNALYEVNLPQADRVEVLKGPASALYGSDAIGGVINVETRRPTDAPSLEAYMEGGAYGYKRALVTGSNTVGSNGFRADLNVTTTDGWRNATGYDRQSATLRWDSYVGSNTTLRTVLTGSRIDQQTAGTSSLSRDQYESDPTLNLTPISLRNVRAARLSTTAEIRGDRTLVSITPFARWNDMELLPNWSLTYDPTIYTTGHSSVGLLARIRRDLGPLDSRVVAGVDVDYSPGSRLENQIVASRTDGIFNQYTTGDVLYDYDVTFRGVSPYVQLDANLTDALHATAGLRFDHIAYDYTNNLEPLQTGRWRRPADASPSYSALSPKLGLAYDLGSMLNIYGNVTRGFRAPSEGQLFRQGSAQNTVELQPVVATSLEAGVRGELMGLLGYTFGVYSMTVSDDILTYTLADGTPETQNAGETLHRGIEAGLNLQITQQLRGDVSYTLARHTYEKWSPRPTISYDGNKMEAAPSSLVNTRLTYTPERVPGSRFGLEWSRVGDYWLNPENTAQYEGHDLLNLHANVAIPGGLEVVGRLMNVTDSRYAELAAFTQARGEELAPGMPRTVYLGLQYTWGR